MNCSWSELDLGWRMGVISEQVKEAIEISQVLNTKVKFEFNKVIVHVNKNSDPNDTISKVLSAVKNGVTKVYGY